MRIRLFSIACVAFTVAPVAAWAQNDARLIPVDQNRPQLNQSNSAASSSSNDAQIAAFLIVDNQNEIAAAQIAEQRAQSDQVKQFAQQMIKDHEKMLGELQQVAGPNGQANQSSQRRDQTAAAGQPGNITSYKLEASGGGAGGGLDLVSFKQQLGAQCQQSQRRELEQKQGAEFDKCYMNAQVAAHMMVVDELQVLENHASPQFRDKLAQAQQTVQGHLDHAKRIAKSLEGGSQASSGQPSGSH